MKRALICMLLVVSASSVPAASFDCTKASAPIEKQICSDSRLSDLDSRLMQSYKTSLSNSKNPDLLKSEQRVWLKNIRNKCQNTDCMKLAYKERITALEEPEITTASSGSTKVPTTSSTQKDPSFQLPVGTATPTHVEQPKANDAIESQAKAATATAPLASRASSSPATSSQPMQQQTLEAPSKDSALAKPVSASAAPLKDSKSNTKPPSTISDISKSAMSLLSFLIMIGLIKPAWILRWDKTPSRAKVIGYLFPIGFLFGGLAEVARTDARKVYDKKIITNKKATEEARYAQLEKDRIVYESNRQGEKLYTYYKSVRGNEDRPGFNEQEYVRGQLISTCNINGKPRGQYGWIEFRTVFIEGYRLKDAPITRMYVFAVVGGESASVMWRGEQYMQALANEMRQTCD